MTRSGIELRSPEPSISIHYGIYIYIYCHPQTDCFVASQHFSVARHVGRLKLGSKPAQIYVRLSIKPLGQQAYHVGYGIIRYYVATAAAAFVYLHFIPYGIPECSIRSKSFALCERREKIPSPECSTPMGECIYCHPRTDCFVVSQLFSVAKHVGRLKLGSKPAQLYCICFYFWFICMILEEHAWYTNGKKLVQIILSFLL